ncbi:UNVERIFIED_CONTAM: ABC transporter G family member 20 [Sesamum radiatum]|uniref:ABC transporter G family member 20 n=1 Tax=Sesamum radiatum TaxID=300843 RepID=A0AAW2KT48_SESRA
MAVLGASGSGKSTLIDALADRIARESLKGTVTLNGEVLESKLLKVISAYVMQDDLLFPMLTVEETFMFSAEFRLPRTMSRSRKKARVQALIDQLGLRSAAKTVIGDEGHRGVSGGERRRVSIGTDIIHDPILLFLDEPTSGLDSTSAYMVVKVLQRIAQSGSIVILSIHQPSYRILSLLDRLIILSHGQTVFSGAPGILPQFFAEFGNPIPVNEEKLNLLSITYERWRVHLGEPRICGFQQDMAEEKPSKQELNRAKTLPQRCHKCKHFHGETGFWSHKYGPKPLIFCPKLREPLLERNGCHSKQINHKL